MNCGRSTFTVPDQRRTSLSKGGPDTLQRTLEGRHDTVFDGFVDLRAEGCVCPLGGSCAHFPPPVSYSGVVIKDASPLILIENWAEGWVSGGKLLLLFKLFSVPVSAFEELCLGR